MMAAPLLSIVVVNWNTRDSLRQCLRSVIEHTVSGHEIIVVDNASSDGSVEMLAAEFPRARVLVNASNEGFARGCNQGMRAAGAELILLLNSDTYVADDVLDRLARYMVERREVSMVACQLRYPDGRLQHTAFRSLGIARSLFEDLWLYKLLPRGVAEDVLLGGYWDGGSEKEVDWLAGAFMLLRRQVFEASGGFDESFFMYGEDSEWCLRLKRAGHVIVYAPLGVVYHVGSVSSDLSWNERARLRLCHLGGFEAYAKLHGRGLGVGYKLARLLGSFVRWAAYALLVAAGAGDYYSTQRRLYGWQVAVCAEALLAPRRAGRQHDDEGRPS
jgi:GT2 family glycosyltransferase